MPSKQRGGGSSPSRRANPVRTRVSAKDSETEGIFARERSRKLPRDIQQVAYRKLRMLNNAQSLADLRIPPGNRLERLVGRRAGQHSIRISDQWRIRFKWHDGDAYDVEIVDYHKER
ncbi:MAG: type II toxin-antitoxin system RelE/ParE family toxin [Armatimonadetes bacterium]|nr:type II toxin-antitoxin system RelE/ParE family toxin [Armatimonadota bacterium]